MQLFSTFVLFLWHRHSCISECSDLRTSRGLKKTVHMSSWMCLRIAVRQGSQLWWKLQWTISSSLKKVRKL